MGKEADHLHLAPLSDDAWSTDPTCCDVISQKNAACQRTWGNYAFLVRSLPPEEQARFACVCCPDRPGVSLVAWALTPVPHTYLVWGAWMVALRIRALRRLLAPPLAPQESLVTICLPCNSDCMLLQMRNEVEARLARGLPVVPTRLAPPAAQSIDRE